MRRVFISHSSLDADYAQEILAALEAAGHKCWISSRDITAGADWSEKLTLAIDGCDVIVLIFSAHADASEEVKRELNLAVAARKHIVPLRIESVTPSGSLRLLLTGCQWLDAFSSSPEQCKSTLLALIEDEAPAPGLAGDDVRASRGNLPAESTSFYGRTAEIAELATLIRDRAIVTLLGPGGVGKSRLALRVAETVIGDVADEAYLVELAAVEDPDGVIAEIADSLGVRELAEKPLIASIADFVAGKKLLLVLDNCEHLIDVCRTTVVALASRSASLRILATSRAPLGADGEWRFPVEPLPAPAAAALFLGRAQGGAEYSALDVSQREAVARICRELDGLPLALELAAARAKTLSFEQIADRLHERFRLFSNNRGDVADRHRTLQALIGWSYELLEGSEQRLLRQLGVVAGRFTFEMVQALDDDADDVAVLDRLTSLIDNSLVASAGTAAGERFYVMLESIRQFSYERLVAAGESAAAQARRVDFWLVQSSQAEIQFSISERRWLERLDAGLDELRSVLGWCLSQPDRVSDGVDISYRTARYWHDTGRFAEAYRLFAAALRAPQLTPEANPRPRARALFGASVMANFLDRSSEAMPQLQEALILFERLHDSRDAARTLNMLGVAAQNRGDWSEAIAYYERCVEKQHEAGDARGETIAMYNLAGALQEDPTRLDEALTIFERTLELAQQSNEELIVAHVLTSLVDITGYRGDVDKALAYGLSGLDAWTKLRNVAYRAEITSRLAWFSQLKGRNEAARRYIAQSVPELVEHGNAADISNTVLFFSAIIASPSNRLLCRELLTFSDQLRGESERARTLFEMEFRRRATEIVQAHGDGDTPPSQRATAGVFDVPKLSRLVEEYCA